MQVPIDSIQILENRHRKVFDEAKVKELAESIGVYGLLHPPVVRPNENNDGLILMAGERRLRAVQALYASGRAIPEIPLGNVPVTFFNTLDAITAKEIELEENLRRVDLSWKETALATAELHQLRKASDPSWTASKTVEEIKDKGGASLNPTAVRNRVLIAENLERPEVASAGSEAQAVKNLTRLFENEFRAALAKKEEIKTTRHTLENCDAIEGIRQFVAAGSVDVVVTDPPYGIDAENFGVQTVTEIHSYADDWESVEALIEETIICLGIVCKEQAHVYMFCDLSHWDSIKEMFEFNGWDVWNRPLIWVKNTGYTPKPDYGPRRNYETIMFASRGRKMVTGVYSDVLTYNAVQDKEHAAQKPVEVYEDLLKRSTIPGSLVLDPFCGSVVVFEAATKLNLRAIGFDSDPSSFQIARGKV